MIDPVEQANKLLRKLKAKKSRGKNPSAKSHKTRFGVLPPGGGAGQGASPPEPRSNPPEDEQEDSDDV